MHSSAAIHDQTPRTPTPSLEKKDAVRQCCFGIGPGVLCTAPQTKPQIASKWWSSTRLDLQILYQITLKLFKTSIIFSPSSPKLLAPLEAPGDRHGQAMTNATEIRQQEKSMNAATIEEAPPDGVQGH